MTLILSTRGWCCRWCGIAGSMVMLSNAIFHRTEALVTVQSSQMGSVKCTLFVHTLVSHELSSALSFFVVEKEKKKKKKKKSGWLIYALHLSTRAKKRNKTYILVVTRYITLLLLLRLSFEKSRSTAMKALSQYRNLYSLTTTDSSAPSTQAKANGCLGGGWGWWWLSQRFLTVPRRRTCCFNIGFFLTFLPSLLTPYNTSAV